MTRRIHTSPVLRAPLAQPATPRGPSPLLVLRRYSDRFPRQAVHCAAIFRCKRSATLISQERVYCCYCVLLFIILVCAHLGLITAPFHLRIAWRLKGKPPFTGSTSSSVVCESVIWFGSVCVFLCSNDLISQHPCTPFVINVVTHFSASRMTWLPSAWRDWPVWVILYSENKDIETQRLHVSDRQQKFSRLLSITTL